MPRDNAVELSEVDTPVGDLKERLVVLTKQLADAEGRKKSAVSGFNAEIKDLREMIKLTVQQIEERGAGDGDPDAG